MASSPKTTLMGVLSLLIVVIAMCYLATVGQLNDRTIAVLLGLLGISNGINAVGNMLSSDASKKLAQTVIDTTVQLVSNPVPTAPSKDGGIETLRSAHTRESV